MDLRIYKGKRFAHSHVLDTATHQKLLNLYLYIPFKSYHPLATKIAFITTELKRYVRLTSSLEEYILQRNRFYYRLRSRGYPPKFIMNCFGKVRYRDRDAMLLRPKPLPSPDKLKDEASRVYFTTSYTPLTHLLPLSRILKENVSRSGLRYKPGIGWKKTRNLQSILCANKPINPNAPALES